MTDEEKTVQKIMDHIMLLPANQIAEIQACEKIINSILEYHPEAATIAIALVGARLARLAATA